MCSLKVICLCCQRFSSVRQCRASRPRSSRLRPNSRPIPRSSNRSCSHLDILCTHFCCTISFIAYMCLRCTVFLVYICTLWCTLFLEYIFSSVHLCTLFLIVNFFLVYTCCVHFFECTCISSVYLVLFLANVHIFVVYTYLYVNIQPINQSIRVYRPSFIRNWKKASGTLSCYWLICWSKTNYYDAF